MSREARFLASVVVLLVISFQAQAVMYNGSLSTATGGLIGSGSWVANDLQIPTTIEWWVDDTTAPGYWHYLYEFIVPDIPGTGGGISHFDLELSVGMERSLLLNISPDPSEVGQLQANQTGMPEGMYGVKFEDFDDISSLTVFFDTVRNPVLGDMFAKGGNREEGNWIRNAGYTLNDQDLDPTIHLLVPDTTTIIPEPVTMAVLPLAALCVGAYVRKRL